MDWLAQIHQNPCKGMQILDRHGKSIYRQHLYPWFDPARTCSDPNGQIAATVNDLFRRIGKNGKDVSEFSIVLGRNRWDPEPYDPNWIECALRQERLDTEAAKKLVYGS